ncbi:proline-rich protein 2-like [Panthera uncia]|uniref:proline-rich protein 2-like n=1 Tax=Panthera uncia TaxID=29064 RepID=UPI0020FF856F|nr:proline-rich protein 2-like [Panthera uncia]
MPPALQIPPCGPQLRPAEAENHGGAARVFLSAEKCGPNSQDRSCPPLTRAAPAWRHRAPGPSPPRGLTATPGPPPRAPDSPPGRAPREERAEAGAGRCGLGICARRPRCPPRPPEVAPAAPQLLPGDRGAEKRARCPPLPPRRCHRREQRRQSRVGRAGLRSFPPRPPGRPPPARRPGQAGSSRESRARGPEPPGTPHSSPAGSALAEGGGLDPSLWGRWLLGGGSHGNAGRGQASGGRGAEPRALAARPHPIPPLPGHTCALRRNRNQESSRDGRGRGGGWRVWRPQVLQHLGP